MGKEKKRKHSRSPSADRKRVQEKTEAKMQSQLDNLTDLLGQLVKQQDIQNAQGKKETEDSRGI